MFCVPWSQPGTDRHGIICYKYMGQLWDPSSTSKLCLLGGHQTPSPAFCFPWGLRKPEPTEKRAYTEIWKPDREEQRCSKVIGVNHPIG